MFELKGRNQGPTEGNNFTIHFNRASILLIQSVHVKANGPCLRDFILSNLCCFHVGKHVSLPGQLGISPTWWGRGRTGTQLV